MSRADGTLLSSLLADEFCYALNTRQMGKSSLAVRRLGAMQEPECHGRAVVLRLAGGDGPCPRSAERVFSLLESPHGVQLCPALLRGTWGSGPRKTHEPIDLFVDEHDSPSGRRVRSIKAWFIFVRTKRDTLVPWLPSQNLPPRPRSKNPGRGA